MQLLHMCVGDMWLWVWTLFCGTWDFLLIWATDICGVFLCLIHLKGFSLDFKYLISYSICHFYVAAIHMTQCVPHYIRVRPIRERVTLTCTVLAHPESPLCVGWCLCKLLWLPSGNTTESCGIVKAVMQGIIEVSCRERILFGVIS